MPLVRLSECTIHPGSVRAGGWWVVDALCVGDTIRHMVEVQASTSGTSIAAARLRAGGVVVLPTETVYGLFGRTDDKSALARIYALKGRPAANPLIAHVLDVVAARSLASSWPTMADRLCEAFWPGPLTIIVPASSKLPLKVTGNTGRLAVRQSEAPVPNQLTELLGAPVIATSANRSGQPTCRSGIEVFGTMDGRVDLVLDGGSLDGRGATTVDITDPQWKLIREAAIPQEAIEECLLG